MITLLVSVLVCLGDPKANLEATAAAYDLAVSKADVAVLDTILAPEVVFTTASGRVMDKKAVLAMLGSPDTRYESVMSDQVVRTVSGDTAIETGRARIKGVRSGKPVNEIQRYTDVWILRKGRWLLLAEHTSLLP
ncbi:MAG: nuclear transport factor 2 family protein [Planctomycetes bacterium]|nr:nuclear transport factor 2 family protein [Planctomycetota bacterium]